ncbi:MAG: hypothetical protein ACE5HB_00675, partial [Terriglobia bacterium]
MLGEAPIRYFRTNALSFLAAALALLLGTAVAVLPTPAAPPQAGQEPQRLEIVEELSESLAHDLLELSLATRDRDERRLAEFFPAAFEATPFPFHPLPTTPELKWLAHHGWSAPSPDSGADNPANKTRRVEREKFLQNLFLFLDHFEDVEDVRFKVKRAQFDDSAGAVLGAPVPTATVGSRGEARVAFFLIGRNVHGQREWVRGT